MQVNHSQKMSEKPLTPWIIAQDDGRILAAHCDCMAGIGETCSHVASLLWVIGVGVERRESLSVTQKSAYWVMPPSVKSVPYSPVREIDFIGKKSKGSTVDTSVPKCSAAPSSKTSKKVPPPTHTELSQFFSSLAACSGAKPAVLAVVPAHCDKYVPTSLSPELPMVLSDLYRPENNSVGYYGLLQIAARTEVTVTAEQVQAVETKTRDQAESRLWFRLRTGRITASKFKSACHTDPANPSLSLIMAICHPEVSRFSTAATIWGCHHEKVALEQYTAISESHHKQLLVSKCGLFISLEHPFIAASPDSIVECLCCGRGICEVKVRCINFVLKITCMYYNEMLFPFLVPILSQK